MRIKISTLSEYLYAKSRHHPLLGRHYEPLKDSLFEVDIGLRKQLQAELFPTDEKFYRYAYEIAIPICEECGCPLPTYSATYVSHIQSRGAYPERRADLRNYNLLCPKHHECWENGERKRMRIYAKNIKTIEQLNNDYESK